MEREKEELGEQLKTRVDEVTALKQQLASLQNEREKLKQKINKLKRRRNVDLNQKICKNCAKEYLENENYNWSCRTHRVSIAIHNLIQSEYGGEMWWCCGKTQKDAQGCKFAKHESKDDEDDEKDKDGDAILPKRLKGIKCQCCKAIGHRTEDCEKDPNMRGGANHTVTSEEKRLINRKDHKRVNLMQFNSLVCWGCRRNNKQTNGKVGEI